MRKLIILFLCIFIFQTVSFAKNETITVISDVYLNSDKKENKMTPSVSKLLKAVEQTNTDTSECVIFLGNNIQTANKKDLVMFAKIVNKLKKPCFVTIGNKDVALSKELGKKEYYRILNKFSSNKIKALPTYKKHGELVFVFMDGTNETFPSYRGYYKAKETEYLDDVLKKFADKKAIIFQHFPVIPPKEDSAKALVKPELYMDVLSKRSNVLAVVSGHYEKENVQTLENVRHISVSSLGKTGEYGQIKIFENKNGTYTITTKVLSVE